MATARPANIRVEPQADLPHESAGFLAALYSLARAYPRLVFDVFSGYRGPGTTGQRSASVGGFSGDPHERGVAADITVGGRPIGSVLSQAELGRFGLMSGNQPGFYQGKPDPSHLQLSSGDQLGKPATSSITGQQFVDALLKAIGAPITQTNRALIGAWAAAEGTSAKFNPLATTQSHAGASNFNSVGVKNYPSFAAGVQATAQTLENGRYPGILRSLRAGNVAPNDIVNRYAGEFNTWGTGAGAVASQLRSGGGGGFLSGVGGALSGVGSFITHGPSLGDSLGLGGIVKPFEQIGAVFSNLTDPHFWLRVLELLGGGVLVLTGLYLLAKQIGMPSASNLAGAVPSTRLAKAAA